MKRIQTESRLEDNKSRWRIRVEDVNTLPGSPEFALRQTLFLEELALNSHMLLNCGPVRYQRIAIFHDGDKWICEAEAIGPSSHEKTNTSKAS